MPSIDEIRTICERYAGQRGFYIGAMIPSKKLTNARASMSIPENQVVIALLDCTFWGSNKNGLSICGDGLRWHNVFSTKNQLKYLNWADFVSATILRHGAAVILGEGNVLDVSTCKFDGTQLIEFLKALQALAAQPNKFPPPPIPRMPSPAINPSHLAAGGVSSSKTSAVDLVNPQSTTQAISHEARRKAMQNQLDVWDAGNILELKPWDEIAGPLIIRKPMTIDGHGATIWSTISPALHILSGGVHLRNLRIEIVGDLVEDENGCALEVAPDIELSLDNVEIQGSVTGLQGEEGHWCIPRWLHLGRLPYRQGSEYCFLLQFYVPVPCQIESQISNLRISPTTLKAGLNDLQFKLDAPQRDALISGSIALKTAFVRRRIPLDALVVSQSEMQTQQSQVSPQWIWRPQVIPVEAAVQPPSPQVSPAMKLEVPLAKSIASAKPTVKPQRRRAAPKQREKDPNPASNTQKTPPQSPTLKNTPPDIVKDAAPQPQAEPKGSPAVSHIQALPQSSVFAQGAQATKQVQDSLQKKQNTTNSAFVINEKLKNPLSSPVTQLPPKTSSMPTGSVFQDKSKTQTYDPSNALATQSLSSVRPSVPTSSIFGVNDPQKINTSEQSSIQNPNTDFQERSTSIPIGPVFQKALSADPSDQVKGSQRESEASSGNQALPKQKPIVISPLFSGLKEDSSVENKK